MQWSEFQFHIRHFSIDDQAIVQKAFEIGKKAHEGQMRESGEPYFTHPIIVAEILTSLGADRDTIIAALLHDTVEDTDLSLEEIRSVFGPHVAQLIDGMTKLAEEDVSVLPTLDEKIETLRKMFTLMQRDVRIMVIKLADRLHNMQTLGFRPLEKQTVVAKETLDIYVKIADRLCMRDLRDELELLCRNILEPEIYAEMIELRQKNRETAKKEVDAITKKIQNSFPDTPLRIQYEDKSWEKLRLQYELEQDEAEHYSLINLVFICNNTDECYHMLGVLHGLWAREALTFDDFINLPIINGYQGLHTTVILDDGVRVRCKIRTEEMEEYAHRGIATKCFDSKEKGIMKYVPWTQRLTPLSADTKDRSEEFWETLQSDILSESIVIYSPTGKSALVPQGATALDGALYLFADKAFRLTSIRANNNQIPLSQKVEHGMTLDITTGETATVHRDWLYWAQTGIGIAMIRTALSDDSDENLILIGKELLQQTLSERGGGYVEEFEKNLIKQSFFSLGYNSEEDGYMAIANRHLEPTEVLSAFEQSYRRHAKGTGEEQKRECIFSFSIDRDVSSMRKLLTVYERFNIQTNDVRMRFGLNQHLRLKVHVRLTAEEMESCRQALIAAGGHSITIHKSARADLVLMSVVVLFWGLNPVWAKYYLVNNISPLTLVSLRSLLFFVFSAALYIGWRLLRKNAYSPIPHVTRLALLPAAATFILSLLTYISVFYLNPSIHLTILRLNALLLPLLHFRHIGLTRRPVIFGLLSMGISIGLLYIIPEISRVGIAVALLCLASYMYYSIVTERTLQEHKIGVRYPHFLFHMGILLGLFGLALMPWIIGFSHNWLPHASSIALYVLLCVFVPHTCFHLVLQRAQFRHVTSISQFEVPLAVILEISMLGLVMQPLAYLSIGAMLITMFILIRLQIIR